MEDWDIFHASGKDWMHRKKRDIFLDLGKFGTYFLYMTRFVDIFEQIWSYLLDKVSFGMFQCLVKDWTHLFVPLRNGHNISSFRQGWETFLCLGKVGGHFFV